MAFLGHLVVSLGIVIYEVIVCFSVFFVYFGV